MLLLEADNARSLMRQLRRLGRRVGPRVERTKGELFCLRRYVATLASNGCWSFPCSIQMGESPDFMIDAGHILYGLELTEATTEALQQALTRHGDRSTNIDDGWMGDEPEWHWCDAVVSLHFDSA